MSDPAVGSPEPQAPPATWPAGWGLRLDPGTRRTDAGRALIGGAPLRVLRLSAAGAAWLDHLEQDGPVPPGPTSAGLARRLVDGGLAHPVPAPVVDRGAGVDAAEVTVVIPVKDDAEGLARTMAGIGSVGSLGSVGQVIVVDDGSADPAAILRAAGPVALVLRHDRALGPAGARQAGWQRAERPVLAFVDADVVAEPGWLEPLLVHLADPTVGAVAPRVAARAGQAPPWLARYEAARSPLDLGPRPSAIRPGTTVPYVPTAALVVRRSALEAVGGFDVSLRVGEDVDLVWRLHGAGWRLRYEPAVRVTHPSRPGFGPWVRQRVAYGSSAARLAARHGAAVAPVRGLSGWSGLAWAGVVAGHPLVGAAVAAGTTAALIPKLAVLDDPVREAARIAGVGHMWAGRSVADAVRRPWWPLAALVGLVHRRSRPALLAAVVVPPLIEWRELRPQLDPVRYGVLRLADDLAYGTGVWLGCLRARSWRAIRPAFSGPVEVSTPGTTAG